MIKPNLIHQVNLTTFVIERKVGMLISQLLGTSMYPWSQHHHGDLGTCRCSGGGCNAK